MKPGFSLIELVVTLGIIALLLVGALPAFRQYGFTNEIERAANTLSAAIIETQTLALAPPKDKEKTHDSYQISFANNNYEIKAGEWDGANKSLKNSLLLKKELLASKINLSLSNPDHNRIIYSIANQGRIIYPSGSLVLTLTLSHSKSSQTKSLFINLETGQVSIK